MYLLSGTSKRLLLGLTAAIACLQPIAFAGQEGRAGMAALVLESSDFDWKKLYVHVCDNLPSYARPIFVRWDRLESMVSDVEVLLSDIRWASFFGGREVCMLVESGTSAIRFSLSCLRVERKSNKIYHNCFASLLRSFNLRHTAKLNQFFCLRAMLISKDIKNLESPRLYYTFFKAPSEHCGKLTRAVDTSWWRFFCWRTNQITCLLTVSDTASRRLLFRPGS